MNNIKIKIKMSGWLETHKKKIVIRLSKIKEY